jgi:ethanolamine utilization protein EutJ
MRVAGTVYVKESADQRLAAMKAALVLAKGGRQAGTLYAGVDLGTAYTVTALVNRDGIPVAGVLTRSGSSIREGLVLDYMGAIGILRSQVETLRQAGFSFVLGAAAYPPGTTGRNAQAFGNVLGAVGLEVVGLVDEPSAASLVLEIRDGAVVDVGGGTTGISVLRDGEVVYTADEPTGGIHVDLVLAGHYGIEVEAAERMKTDPARQAEIFPLIRPVFQKMATIVREHLRGHEVEPLYLVGGTSCFPGIETVMEAETGLAVARPSNPLLVTPLGIALSCVLMRQGEGRIDD